MATKPLPIQDLSGDTGDGTITIKPGDSLGAIAKRYGLSVDQLMAANSGIISDPNKISAGMKIALSPEATKVALAGKPPVKSPTLGKSPAQAAADAASQAAPVQQSGPGFFDSIGNAIKSNPNLATGAIQLGAAGAGYMLTDAERKKQEALYNEQMKKIGGINELQKIQFDPNRDSAYEQQRKFQQDIIEGKGYTAEEKTAQLEALKKAGSISQGAIQAGIENQRRLGGAGIGTAALAGAFSGGQTATNMVADSLRAIDASAQNRMMQATEKIPQSFETQFANQLELGKQKDIMSVERSKLSAKQSDKLAEMSQAKGAALAGLAGTAADLATTGIQGGTIMASNATEAQRLAQQKTDADARTAQAAEAKKLQNKAGGAAQGGSVNTGTKVAPGNNTSNVKQSPVQGFNVNNMLPGSAQNQAATAKAIADKAKDATDKAKQAANTAMNTFNSFIK